jgi:hypothetical protein
VHWALRQERENRGADVPAASAMAWMAVA